jgi:hypothetical protein
LGSSVLEDVMEVKHNVAVERNAYGLPNAEHAGMMTSNVIAAKKNEKIERTKHFIKSFLVPQIDKAISEGMFCANVKTQDDVDANLVCEVIKERGYKIKYFFDREAQDHFGGIATPRGTAYPPPVLIWKTVHHFEIRWP